MGIGVSFLVVQLQKDSCRIPTESNRSEHLSWLEPQPPQTTRYEVYHQESLLHPSHYLKPLSHARKFRFWRNPPPTSKSKGNAYVTGEPVIINWKLQFFRFFHSFGCAGGHASGWRQTSDCRRHPQAATKPMRTKRVWGVYSSISSAEALEAKCLEPDRDCWDLLGLLTTIPLFRLQSGCSGCLAPRGQTLPNTDATLKPRPKGIWWASLNTVCLKQFRDAQAFKSLFLETPLKRRGSGRSFETDLDLRAAHLVFELDSKYSGTKKRQFLRPEGKRNSNDHDEDEDNDNMTTPRHQLGPSNWHERGAPLNSAGTNCIKLYPVTPSAIPASVTSAHGFANFAANGFNAPLWRRQVT